MLTNAASLEGQSGDRSTGERAGPDLDDEPTSTTVTAEAAPTNEIQSRSFGFAAALVGLLLAVTVLGYVLFERQRGPVAGESEIAGPKEVSQALKVPRQEVADPKGAHSEPTDAGNAEHSGLGPRRAPPRPPPEGIRACATLQLGDRCIVDLPYGPAPGYCTQLTELIACRPERGPGEAPDGRSGRPPEERPEGGWAFPPPRNER
jgi:hypothetical protein